MLGEEINMFNVGDRIEFTGVQSGKTFDRSAGTVYAVHHQKITVVFDHLTSGHNDAIFYGYSTGGTAYKLGLPKPKYNKSWNIGRENLTNVKVIGKLHVSKYAAIEYKILEMRKRRESLGYKY